MGPLAVSPKFSANTNHTDLGWSTSSSSATDLAAGGGLTASAVAVGGRCLLVHRVIAPHLVIASAPTSRAGGHVRLSANINLPFHAPAPVFAAGMHAQHSTYEADVRARAIPCRGEVAASRSIVDDVPAAPSRSGVTISDAILAGVLNVTPWESNSAISTALASPTLGVASPAYMITVGIARSPVLNTMYKMRQRVTRGIVDVLDART